VTGWRGVKRGVWVAAMLIAAAALAGWAGWRWLAGGGETALPEEVETDSRPRLTSSRVVGRRQGERQFELDAGVIADDDDWVRIDRIENGVLYRDGRVFVTFDADYGRWHRPTNNLILSGSVVLVYDQRVHMRTEELEWRAEEELVVAPGPVSMVIDGDTVEAGSMEADVDKERVRLLGQVRIRRASGGVLEMDEVVYWLAEERLEGYGRGRVVFGGDAAAGPRRSR